MTNADPGTVALVLSAGAGMFVLGGLVKGTLGVGLPLVVVPMLSLLIPAPRAMGLLVVPVLLSNLWQAYQGGRLRYTVRRFAPLSLAQLGATVLTVRYTRDLSLQAVNALMALAVISAVVLMAVKPRGALNPRQEKWIGPLVGTAAGMLGGVSSLTGPAIIVYLMALRLPRDEFVGSISIIYLFGSLPLYMSMLWFGRFGIAEVGWSVLALVPMFLGLRLGQALRHRLSEKLFRRILFAFLCGLALLLLLVK